MTADAQGEGPPQAGGGADPLNAAVSRALLVGSLASAVLLAAGLAIWLAFGGAPAGSRTLSQWLDRLGSRDPAAVVFIGLLAVTLTPVASVLAALGASMRRREWREAGVALCVLAIVIGSAAVAILVGHD